MDRHRLRPGLALGVLLAIAMCCVSATGAPERRQIVTPAAAAMPRPPVSLATVIPVPHYAGAPTAPFSFGDGRIDTARALYLLSDRNAGAVDVFDTRRNRFLRRIAAGACRLCRFTGLSPVASPQRAGPGAIELVPGTSFAWVGDVGSVKLLDYVVGAILKSVAIAGNDGFVSAFRSEHACYDVQDHMLMVVNPDDPAPFATFVRVGDAVVLRRIVFPSAVGLGNCLYLAKQRRFYLANAGDRHTQNGSLLSYSAPAIRAGRREEPRRYAFSQCSPRGLAADERNTTVLVSCDAVSDPTPTFSRAAARVQLLTLVFDTRTQRYRAPIAAIGGGDDVAYNSRRRWWYVAAPTMTVDGYADGTASPALGIIDASTERWLANVSTGVDAHSVSVDERTGDAYVPVPETAGTPPRILVFEPLACARRGTSC